MHPVINSLTAIVPHWGPVEQLSATVSFCAFVLKGQRGSPNQIPLMLLKPAGCVCEGVVVCVCVFAETN